MKTKITRSSAKIQVGLLCFLAVGVSLRELTSNSVTFEKAHWVTWLETPHKVDLGALIIGASYMHVDACNVINQIKKQHSPNGVIHA